MSKGPYGHIKSMLAIIPHPKKNEKIKIILFKYISLSSFSTWQNKKVQDYRHAHSLEKSAGVSSSGLLQVRIKPSIVRGGHTPHISVQPPFRNRQRSLGRIL